MVIIDQKCQSLISEAFMGEIISYSGHQLLWLFSVSPIPNKRYELNSAIPPFCYIDIPSEVSTF